MEPELEFSKTEGGVMSIWSEDPEWFDEWLEQRALEGRFGDEIREIAEAGNFAAWEWWDRLDVKGELGQEAMTAYVEGLIP